MRPQNYKKNIEWYVFLPKSFLVDFSSIVRSKFRVYMGDGDTQYPNHLINYSKIER